MPGREAGDTIAVFVFVMCGFDYYCLFTSLRLSVRFPFRRPAFVRDRPSVSSRVILFRWSFGFEASFGMLSKGIRREFALRRKGSRACASTVFTYAILGANYSYIQVDVTCLVVED